MARQRPRDAVQFTRESAERIASVVRSAELSPAVAAPLSFDRIAEGRIPKQVRAATFSGSWPIGSNKVVTFTNMPTSTATVQNMSWPITENGYSNEPCIVGKDGTAWYLVVPVLQTATAVFATTTQQRTIVSGTASQNVSTGLSQGTYASGFQTFAAVTDVSISAELNTSNCAITIGKTLTTSEIRVVSGTATAFFASGTTTISVCSATATAVMITQTATSTILRLRLP
jgi:hypothetical protein